MKEVARLAGVSRPVVSAILNNRNCSIRFTPEVRERVIKVMRETGYVPNIAAQQLKGISSPLVGLLTVHSKMGIVTIFQAELITVLQKNKFEVLTAQISVPDDYQKAIGEFKARNVIGVIALNSAVPLELDCPVIHCPHGTPGGFDIGCDISQGEYMAAKHMIEVHGRRRFAFMGQETPLDSHSQRKYDGMVRAMEEYGISASYERNFCKSCEMSGVLNFLKKHDIDAIFCSNDTLAANLIPRLIKHGIRVPEDIAVIGFDGYAFAQFTSVPLATVVQPVLEISEKTVELLKTRLKNKINGSIFNNSMIPPEFHPKASCGCNEELSDKLDACTFQMLSTKNHKNI